MSMLVILLGSYLLAGQFVRKWRASIVAGLVLWTALVVAVHLVILH